MPAKYLCIPDMVNNRITYTFPVFRSFRLPALSSFFKAVLLLLLMVSLAETTQAQEQLLRGAGGRLKQFGRKFSGGSSTDSLQRRDKNEDSITIRFRYLDSTRNFLLDSSINDYSQRFPLPASYVWLGNNGTAAHSLLFEPAMQAGWDPGFHGLDIYRWSIDKARFFNTTRPYSELNYQIASRSEQIIEIVHTQNIKPNWNFLFQYRLINSPGFFKNQKSNHNNYLFTSWYQSVNKRYNAYLILLGNKLAIGENGGIWDTTNVLSDPVYKDRYNIGTKLGGDPVYGSNFFSTDVGTGNRYNEFSVVLRQQYDLGRKDSLVTDSSVIPLFYPRLRFEHTLQLTQRKYNFRDYVGDSTYYKDHYGITLPDALDTVIVQDKWRDLINDFSIYQYPDANNLQQFIKLGASYQNLQLHNLKGTFNFYNIFGHAEYRNRTRNQKWDLEANGQLYFVGLNAGDYAAVASLQRYVGKRRGYIRLGFENTNRRPSFIFDERSSFYLSPTALNLKKENIVHLSAALYQPLLKLKLSGHYYLLTNYTYLRNWYELAQEGTVFNTLQIAVQKTIDLGKNWKWHADVYFQQVIGNAPVNLPAVFTRNRIGYEGKLGFPNLNIAFGAEIKYHTAYKGDAYSPVLGRFQYQDTTSIRNQVPHITGYVHFRIRAFKFYFRAENLNTARVKDGFGFTNNIIESAGYPYPGLMMRFGIYWSFVN